jgi:hypothetical protein
MRSAWPARCSRPFPRLRPNQRSAEGASRALAGSARHAKAAGQIGFDLVRARVAVSEAERAVELFRSPAAASALVFLTLGVGIAAIKGFHESPTEKAAWKVAYGDGVDGAPTGIDVPRCVVRPI